jgi:hypothetical protein
MAHELRTCGWCFGAGRYAHAAGPMERPVVVVCERCGGMGKTWAFLYADATRATVRRMAEEEVVRLCWTGTAKEKVLAEKELRRRNGGSR